MPYTKISGIYKIYCNGNGKPYIGSAVCIKGRWASHRHYLKESKHGNRHLQNAWNKYGAESFKFSIIETCPVEQLITREQFWIDHYKAADPDFGMNNSPTASTTIGFRHSDETKRLLSHQAKNRDHTRLRILAESMRGKPGHNKGKPGVKWSDERKALASMQRKGQKPWNVGIPMPQEIRDRVSATLLASGKMRKIPEYMRASIISLRNEGKSYPKISKETGVSISQCQKIFENNTRKSYRTVEKVKGAEGNR